MNNLNKKCEECGKLLGESQYARLKREGERTSKREDNLACRNYPDCSRAEKEIRELKQ